MSTYPAQPADIAEAGASDMLLDIDGTVWVRRGDTWAYVTFQDTLTDWDTRDRLPQAYEPYAPIDEAAQRVILKGLGLPVPRRVHA